QDSSERVLVPASLSASDRALDCRRPGDRVACFPARIVCHADFFEYSNSPIFYQCTLWKTRPWNICCPLLFHCRRKSCDECGWTICASKARKTVCLRELFGVPATCAEPS